MFLYVNMAYVLQCMVLVSGVAIIRGFVFLLERRRLDRFRRGIHFVV